MKPTFILFAGTAWSATTPLYYTLHKCQNYLHGGIGKEHYYLNLLDDGFLYPNVKNIEFYRKKFIETKNNCINNTLELNKTNVLNFGNTFSIDNYISFYTNLWKNLDNKYQAVADFTNTNADLSENFIEKFAEKILPHFNVKVLIIFRDPIRRLFSKTNHFYYNCGAKYNYNTAYEVLLNMKNYVNYVDIYEKYKKYFPIHQIIMEELWEDDGLELKKLSYFLNYEIKKLHLNVYSPDRGNKPIAIKNLSDQYTSDIEILSNESYNILFDKFKFLYEDYVRKFDRLPLHWGSHINYEINQSLPISKKFMGDVL